MARHLQDRLRRIGGPLCTPLLSVLAAPVRLVDAMILAMAEAGPRMESLRRLNDTDDRDLGRRGLDRGRELRRIVAARHFR